tara:strand:+ start:209 stop:1063 length:855 start_codon:yes stop_codon:yes gene_type:complete
MSARIQIKMSSLSGVTDTFINIPIDMTPHMVDQAELVDKVFVDVEVEKSINPILDYEKSRFSPIFFDGNNQQTDINNIIYDVRFLSSSTFPSSPSFYSDIEITNDDIKFGKKRFENSFLNLSFYDTDRATDQRLLSFINIFPRLTSANVQGPLGVTPGLPLPANQIPVTFTLSNPIKNPEGFAEGYYIYNYKDEVTSQLPKEIFMRARFDNMANGKTINLMTEGVAYGIEELVNKLYTKYILHRNNTGYFYAIDETYNTNLGVNNVTLTSGGDYMVTLYQIQAL